MAGWTARRTAQMLLLATVAVWGGTFVLVKDALQDASPLVFNLVRMALAALALLVVNRRALGRVTRAQMLQGGAVGVFLAAGYQLQTLGLARTAAAKSALLTGLVVVFVPLLTLIPGLRPDGAARPGGFTAVGAALAFTGLLLLTVPPGTVVAGLSGISLGDLLTLACALAFAGHLLALAHLSRARAATLDAGLLATLQIGAATLTMLATLPLEPQHHFSPSLRLAAALLITSLLGTAAAFTIQSYAQRHLPPTHTAVLLTLEPVFGWATSWLILGERMGRRPVVGALLILAGIAVIEVLGHAAQTTEIPA
jgi:drug/metabolite transporter (DMT)-like permease